MTMRLFILLTAVALGDQDKARRALLAEVRKLLAGGEKDRVAACEKLAEMPEDDQATELLITKLTNDSLDVRLAAADALGKHRKMSALNALGRALTANFRDDTMAKAYLNAMGRMGLCAGIKRLLQVIELDKYLHAEDALGSISKIGCPECVPALVGLLRRAEIEAKKPDQIENREYQGGGPLAFPGIPGGVYGRLRFPGNAPPRFQDNPEKNKDLARLVTPLRETLQDLTGIAGARAADWEASLESGKLSFPLVWVWYCEVAKKTFDVQPREKKKCPYEDKVHSDTFLQHRRP